MAYDFSHEGKEVFVVTSDGAEQNTILGAGAYRITVRELQMAVKNAKKKMRKQYIHKVSVPKGRNELADYLQADVLEKLEELRKKK